MRGASEHHLTDAHTGMQSHWTIADIEYFQGDLSRRMTETGIDKAGCNVHHHAQSGQ